MGQKIHPYGYRVGITQPHSARWFANSYQYPQYVYEDFLLRQSLFKNLPVENLPRKRSDDKSETKLVQIKIERLIRNTIKIKLYMTSPENFSDLFERENLTKFSKKDSGNVSQSKVKANKDANLLLLNIQKKLLNKRIVHLKLLKLKNMHYKFLTMQKLLDKTSSNSTSNTIFPAKNLLSPGSINMRNADLASSYTSFSLLSGIKELLNQGCFATMIPFFKIKYLFYFIQLKIQFFKNLDKQLELYQNLQKQTLLNFSTLNGESQSVTTLRITQLTALQKQIKTILQYLTTTFETVKDKLVLQGQQFETSISFKVESGALSEAYSKKCSILINILKIKSILQKNNLNNLESFIIDEKIAEIKLRWFNNVNSSSTTSQTSVTINESIFNLKAQLQKQKLLTILAKFKVSINFYNYKIEKIKKFILSTLVTLSKVTSSELFKNGKLVSTNLTELKIFLSKAVLIIKKFDTCLCQNFQTLKERLISKINTLATVHQNFKENVYLRKIINLIEEKSLANSAMKFSLVHKNFLKLVNVSLNKGLFLTNPTLVFDGFNNYFGKYAFLLKNKSLSSNLVILSTLVEKTNYSNLNTYGNFLRKEYLSSLIQSIHSFKTNLKDKNLPTKLYKFALNLLNQRYKLNNLLEIKLKSLLISNKLETVKVLNNYLKINTSLINILLNWVKVLKKKLMQNTSNNLQLLRTRIYKINCYLKKVLKQISLSETKKLTESNLKLSFKIEKNLVFINYNILKQKLVFELLKTQRSQILSQNNNNNSLSLIVPKLALQNNKLQKRILELENKFKQEKNDTELSLQTENKITVSNTLSLKTNLQQLLKQNYQNNFVVLQSRRQVYNAVINRFGGHRNPHFGNNTTWKNPFETKGTQALLCSNVAVGEAQNLKTENSLYTSDKNGLLPLLDAVKQKIYDRKPLKLKETRKQQFLAKKTIKKKLKQFLILLALQNNYNNLASLKNIYNVPTLSNVCENLTTLQTIPKVSVIELVKVRQPKQYAVCLANFIVENLEKRFSFRSTMKKAAEQAMSTVNVKGIKIQISGRLNGAEIARTEWLRDGVVPLQTLRANIDYSYKTAKTIYGILGVKVWLFKDSTMH